MSYDIDLSGRVAMVSGASSGLGAQFARTLAKAGAGVVLAARRMERLKALRAEIEAEGGDAHVVELDVTDTDSIKAAVARLAIPHENNAAAPIVTVSIGYSVRRPLPGDNADSLVHEADRWLYEAKHHGRNRIEGCCREL